jgi:hypothetical protein
MAQIARWIRFDPAQTPILTACRAFARSQGERGAPVCLWGRSGEPVRLDEDLWAGPGEFVFALLVPQIHAPGRRDRWVAWGLSPVVAALRRFGARAYLDGNVLCMHGARIGGGSLRELDDCAAIFGVFPCEPPQAVDEPERGKLLQFDPWLSALNHEGRSRQLLAAFRSALEVQHGWQFDTGWPSEAERSEITAEAVQ